MGGATPRRSRQREGHGERGRAGCSAHRLRAAGRRAGTDLLGGIFQKVRERKACVPAPGQDGGWLAQSIPQVRQPFGSEVALSARRVAKTSGEATSGRAERPLGG